MNRHIFIALPVADLAKSEAFFKALGFDFNPQFCGDGALCLAVSEAIQVMLVTHAKFTNFTPKAICDTQTTTEVLLTLTCESREEVDELVAKAVSAGGTTHGEPDDYGFMYQFGFSDLDGHQWGLCYFASMPPK